MTNTNIDRPLRIAYVDYVLDPYKPGRTGLSDIVWDMARALFDLGHEPHVIASYNVDTYPDPRVTVHNFTAPPMGYRNIVGNLWLLNSAANIAKELKPDIVHAPEYISTAVFASLGVETPLVLTVPGNIYHRIMYGHSFEWHFVQVLKWAAITSARKCSYIIATSQEMKRWWEMTGSSPDRTPLIPYGVDTNRFHPVDKARVILGLPEDKLIFLYVGRFATEKGLIDLIDAVALLSLEVNLDQVEFILIGRGPMRGAMEARIHAQKLEKIITLRDWVDQHLLATWYSAADAFMLPSHSEAFSRTIPEAMSCGTPVIGSAITGTEDHVKDGQNGFLFPPKSPESLAEILQQQISNRSSLNCIGMHALQYARDNLRWPHIMSRIIQEVYISCNAEKKMKSNS
jgi:glycosyltransferase involved in cell wall biosynthesis